MIKFILNQPKVLILLIAVFHVALATFAFAAPSTQVRISRLDDTTHIEFEGSKQWNYKIQRSTPNLLVVTLDKISPEAQNLLKSYKDNFVSGVEVAENSGRLDVSFNLTDAGVEHFDYMTDDPSLLIIDLYKKAEDEKPLPAQVPVPKKIKSPKTSAPKAFSKFTASDSQRAPSSKEILLVEEDGGQGDLEKKFGAFDAGDNEFGRFQIKDYEIREEAIIASKQNIYLELPPLMMPVSRLDYWIGQQPEYVITPRDTQESKEAQLLTTLYYRGRNNLFLKTYQYFTNKYPESEYKEILQNLMTDIYLKRWVKDRAPKDYELAKNQLSDLVERYPNSPLIKRNQFLLAYANMERGESLPALESIQKLLRLYPKDTEAPHLKLAQAESLMGIKKYEDASTVYSEIIRDYANTDMAAQAKYRLGDVAMRSKNWPAAVSLYDEALKNKKYEDSFPNAHFNKGEALFWMGKYKESVDEFSQFIKIFPSHPNGAFAMTRIGELFDILGANKKRSMGAYLESYFRYPDHPGSKIARIRMLTQKMKSMKDKEMEKTEEEIKRLEKEIGLKGIGEFVALLYSEGLEARQEYQKSFDLLSSYYQQHPNSPHRQTIQNRVRKNIANEIRRKSEAKDYIGSLKYYEKYAKTWLQQADRLDVNFYRGLNFEQAGVFDQAHQLYSEIEARLRPMIGSLEEKERRVQEDLPSLDRLNLRLARVSMELKDSVGSYKALKKVDESGLKTNEEKIERVQLMADLFMHRGELVEAEKALTLLEDKFKENKTLLKPVLVKHGQILNSLKKYEEAIKAVDPVLKDSESPDSLKAQAYTAKVESQIALGQKASAIDTLQEMLERLETKIPMETSRYRLGELLFEKGDLVSAEAVWKKLDGVRGNVLSKIASEKLESAKFQKDYKKYIQRIPAMANEATQGKATTQEKEKPKGGM